MLRPSFIKLIALAVLLGSIGGCAVNPVTGKHELALIPEGQELAIGAEQYLPSQQSQGGVYSVDQNLTAYVSDVGQRLAAVSDRNLPYEFVVLNNSVPNAWALPGGKIAVNRGLLLELDNEAELAAVLGHEIVHAAARHGANAMQRGMLLQSAIMVTAIAAADFDYANYVVGGAQLGAQLVSQKYGRSAELEADYYGTRYMKRAGYDSEAAISLQQTFVRLSEGHETSWLEGLFASHPPSEERVEANKETARSLGAGGELNRDRYQEKIAYIKSRQDAYAAFDQANQLAAGKDLAPALARVNQAIAIEPAEPRFYGLRGDILLAQGKYAPAAEEFDKALLKDDGYYEYYLGRGLAMSKLGKTAAARNDLERSNQLLPTAVATNALGEISLASGNRAAAKEYFQTAMTASGTVAQQAATSFYKLDLPENPGRYIETRPSLTEDLKLIAVVKNNTNIPVSYVQIEFQVTVNGNRVRRVVSVNNIDAGAQGTVPSGMQFNTADVLSDAQVLVTGVRL